MRWKVDLQQLQKICTSIDKDTYMVINTSCEHITQEQYNTWLANIPGDVYIVLQSNNFKDHEEHVNCMMTDEFKRSLN